VVNWFHFLWDKCFEDGKEAIGLSNAADHPSAEVQARVAVAFAAVALCEPAAMRLYVNDCLNAANELRDSFWVADSLWINETVLHLNGDWHSARVLSNYLKMASLH